jgi:hypothetical protein
LALKHACVAYQNAMMRRMKPILVAGLCGALVALLATRIGLPRIASIPFFRKDHALLSTQVRNYGDVFGSSSGSQPLVFNLYQKVVKIAAGEGPLEG